MKNLKNKLSNCLQSEKLNHLNDEGRSRVNSKIFHKVLNQISEKSNIEVRRPAYLDVISNLKKTMTNKPILML